MNRILKMSIPFCALLMLVATAFFLQAGAAGARAAVSQTCGTWNTIFSPNPSTTLNHFNGVATLAANDAWAVGYYQPDSTSALRTLIEQWNGSQWNVVASPSAGQNSFLYGVAASSPTNAWTVGHSTDSNGNTTALIEHWNGTSWTIVPNPASSGSALYGVTISSPNTVWAVGASGAQTLIERWNGTSWKVVPSPSPVMHENTLTAVAHVKGTNQVWAVGFYMKNETDFTLIEKWNGTSWQLITSSNPGSGGNELQGVTTVSASDVWAVGYYYNTTTAPQTLTEHWNGSQWSVIPSPNVSTSSEDLLFGVSALSTNNAWAVGYYIDGSTALEQTLTEQWDGSHWNIVPSPNKGAHNNELLGVSAISGTQTSIWAVGDYNLGKFVNPPFHTLAEFHC